MGYFPKLFIIKYHIENPTTAWHTQHKHHTHIQILMRARVFVCVRECMRVHVCKLVCARNAWMQILRGTKVTHEWEWEYISNYSYSHLCPPNPNDKPTSRSHSVRHRQPLTVHVRHTRTEARVLNRDVHTRAHRTNAGRKYASIASQRSFSVNSKFI